jgi:DNA-binding GntR family transcriptional regulator
MIGGQGRGGEILICRAVPPDDFEPIAHAGSGIQSMAGDTTLEKTNAERAYRLLREEIITGDLPPGLKLKIEMLRSRYALGAGPLREALARLSSDHLVELVGQRGFVVAPMSIDDANDVGRVRKLLEVESLKDSIEHGDDDWEAGVVAAFHSLERIEQRALEDKQPDFAEWERRNRRFHEALVAACASPWVLRMRNTVFEQHERYRHLSRVRSFGSRDVSEEHRQLLNASINRETARATDVIAGHIQRTTDIVVAALNGMEIFDAEA